MTYQFKSAKETMEDIILECSTITSDFDKELIFMFAEQIFILQNSFLKLSQKIYSINADKEGDLILNNLFYVNNKINPYRITFLKNSFFFPKQEDKICLHLSFGDRKNDNYLNINKNQMMFMTKSNHLPKDVVSIIHQYILNVLYNLEKMFQTTLHENFYSINNMISLFVDLGKNGIYIENYFELNKTYSELDITNIINKNKDEISLLHNDLNISKYCINDH